PRCAHDRSQIQSLRPGRLDRDNIFAALVDAYTYAGCNLERLLHRRLQFSSRCALLPCRVPLTTRSDERCRSTEASFPWVSASHPYSFGMTTCTSSGTGLRVQKFLRRIFLHAKGSALACNYNVPRR